MKIPRIIRYSLLALVMSIVPASSFAGVVISVGIAPPVLPVYVQPACPGDGYIWTPGYWAYGDDGYYWVPGTWVLAPEPGFLWTPGYWGWGGSAYLWHPGYWGPHVGFYGGVNYGFGYFGVGYAGGYWHGRDFFYNRSVNNVTITNVHIYNRTVEHVTVTRVSYNGGRGGINMRPNREQERWDHERHFEATHSQMDHEHAARGNREFLASVNHGRPAVAATARPGDFHGRDVAPARGFRPAEGRPMNRPAEGRSMDRGVPHPDNSARNNGRPDNGRPNTVRANNERPMPRQDSSMNRGGGRPNQASRPENRGQGRSDLAPNPTPYHAGNGGQHQNAPRGNPAPHEGAPRGNAAPHGNPQHGGGNDGHGRH
ncbi:MAG TPA: hypothetical protein VL349_11525 [Terriglobales bacterium]|nr:hypothetical protein [Terriglobales bacterium]